MSMPSGKVPRLASLARTGAGKKDKNAWVNRGGNKKPNGRLSVLARRGGRINMNPNSSTQNR